MLFYRVEYTSNVIVCNLVSPFLQAEVIQPSVLSDLILSPHARRCLPQRFRLLLSLSRPRSCTPHGRDSAAPRELSPAVAGLLLLSLARGPLQSRGKTVETRSRALLLLLLLLMPLLCLFLPCLLVSILRGTLIVHSGGVSPCWMTMFEGVGRPRALLPGVCEALGTSWSDRFGDLLSFGVLLHPAPLRCGQLNDMERKIESSQQLDRLRRCCFSEVSNGVDDHVPKIEHLHVLVPGLWYV